MGTVKKVAWISTLKGHIGVAVTEDDSGNQKGRILQVNGIDEEVDIISIAQFGTEFPLNLANEFCDKEGSKTDVKY